MKKSMLTLSAAVATVLAIGHAEAQVATSGYGLPLALAMEAAAEAVRVCEGNGYAVSASVVDPSGLVKVQAKGDHSTVHTRDSSFRKAYTVVTLGPIFRFDATSAFAELASKNPSDRTRNACRAALTPEAIRTQYVTGADEAHVSPDGYALDIAYFARPGNDEIQLDLVYDYRTNVALYGAWQVYFRQHKPPLLALWGEKDIYFLPPGAKAFRRDIPDAELHFYDTGHFALETHGAEIGDAMLDFLDRKVRG